MQSSLTEFLLQEQEYHACLTEFLTFNVLSMNYSENNSCRSTLSVGLNYAKHYSVGLNYGMPRLSHLGYAKHHNLSPSFFILQKTELEYTLYQTTNQIKLYVNQFILQRLYSNYPDYTLCSSTGRTIILTEFLTFIVQCRLASVMYTQLYNGNGRLSKKNYAEGAARE